LKKLLAAGFFLFMLLVAYWADTRTMPGWIVAVTSFPNSDRVGHVVLYATLAYLLTVAFPFKRVKVWRWSIPLGVVIALAFASLEEFSQLFVPGRTADFIDLGASYLGIYLSMWIPCMKPKCEA
jgi:polysaccharide biosynthesis protein VpsQ